MPIQATALLVLGLCVGLVQAAATTKPPVSNPPQFIVFTHDDGVAKANTDLVLSITDKYRNPNGCRLPVTWFACTKGCSGFSCSTALSLYKRGHEIGDHTVTHRDLRKLSKSEIKKEIAGARSTIVKCGIPKSAVQGFRCPFLSDKPDVRTVLAELGFRYDSTIASFGGPRRLWPARLDKGMPFNCNYGGQQCSSTERNPLWEVPLYATGDGNTMDPCTNENNGRPESGCDAYKVLKTAFDNAYAGNKGPFEISVHSPWLARRSFHSALDKFLAHAMSKPNVWAVTMSQLLDWMENPVPANKMKAFMAKYKCP